MPESRLWHRGLPGSSLEISAAACTYAAEAFAGRNRKPDRRRGINSDVPLEDHIEAVTGWEGPA